MNNDGGFSHHSKVRKTKSIKKKVFCSLEDLYKGRVFRLTITPKVICKNCRGEGGLEGYRVPCRHCGGNGVVFQDITDLFFGRRRIEVECSYCQGAGAYFNNNHICPVCHGNRLIQERREVDLYLEPGMGNGSVIRLPQGADEAPGMIAGDILFLVNEKSHPAFQRSGPDLQIHMTVSLGESLCGFTRQITHLDGRILHIVCNAGEVQVSRFLFY